MANGDFQGGNGVWVSVDDAMPRIGSDVVVFIPRGFGGPGIDVQRCYNGGRQNPVWHDGWNKGQRLEITHWMKVAIPAGY
jgi:hypothetical protein